jgi:hypothetical protein
MGCEPETFFSLLRDAAHWEFELFLILLFDVIIGILLMPLLKKYVHKHFHNKED